ncbi:tetratricopeptide repeat protein [Bacteroidota bacterium]
MKTYKILSGLLFIIIYSQLAFAQDITTDTTMANSYFEKAGIFKDSTQYDSAIIHFEKASLLYEKNELWRKYLDSEIKHSECFQRQWQLDQSIATIKPAIEKTLLHMNENNIVFSYAYHFLGLQYYFLRQADSTLFYWKKVLHIKKEILGEKHIDIAKAYNNIGIVYSDLSEFDLALQYYFKFSEIYKELFGEKHTDVATCYNNIAIVYSRKNEFDLALQYSFQSLQIFKELLGEKHLSLTMVYSTLGIIYTQKNEYELALLYYLKALQIYKEHSLEIRFDVASTYNNIGIIYHNKNEFDLALEYLLKAGQIYKELFGENHPEVASNYNNLGAVYSDKSNFDLAAQYFLKSLQIAKEIFGENHMNVSDTYSNLGLVYASKKDYNTALEYNFKSLQIRNEILGEKHTDVATSYNNIGLVYWDKKDYNTALKYYFKALQIDKELFGEKHSYVAKSYMNIGNVYKVKREYDKALQYYQKGIASSLRNFNDTVNIYSVPIIEDYMNWIHLIQCLQTKIEILANKSPLANLGVSLRHYQACDTLISQARQSITTKSDKLALGEYASEVYIAAVNVCVKLSDNPPSPFSKQDFLEQAFYFSEKNKSSVLLEALASAEAQKFAGIPDSLLSIEHNLQINIALYKTILAEQPDSANKILFENKLFNANRQYDELITLFESQYPEYFELKYNRKPACVEEIQKILDDKTAIISYFTGDSIITIFTVTNKNMDIKTVPAVENLAQDIRDFRNGLLYTSSSRFSDAYKKHAFKMYGQLIPENLDERIQNLIIIPDAELSMIPFETLLTENLEDEDWKELPYLIKKYNISYSYSANLFYKTFPKELTNKIEYTDLNDWLAFAPVFDDQSSASVTLRTRELLREFDNFSSDTIGKRGTLISGEYISPILASQNEVEEIFKQFDQRGKKALVQIKQSANEKFLKSEEIEKYKYLHFATHGFVNTEKPELSGILLAQDSTINEDGILYSGEIYNLKLNADLTVLSACETGLGEIKKGEGLIGLTRALLFAGSKNIIVSLWKVADESTSDLMIDFYKNLLEEEQEKQEFSKALQQAKLKMINEGKYAHPFYWSPFILIGK